MVYTNSFKGENLSALGLGTMRLPVLTGGAPGDIDTEQLDSMVDYAIEHGVNYFDTAFMYHDYKSEKAIGASLSRYPREKWNLATKYPGHEIHTSYDVAGTFKKQLENCGVDYFDFYLLHNVNNSSMKNYMNPELGFVEYFIEMKRQGKIRHLGFSCHGDVDCINRFLDTYGDEIEFCQIQLNYLDWTLQGAKEKYELLTSRGVPVWVMEPVRGGKLAEFQNEDDLKNLHPDWTTPAWAFHFLQRLENVKVVLSGMSSIDQMMDNCRNFEKRIPLTDEETALVMSKAEGLKELVPCTKCRYCCAGCPMQIDIPKMIAMYNDFLVHPSMNISILLSSIPKEQMPESCLKCGQCSAVCPQRINVPDLMDKINGAFKTLPEWEKLCLERERASEKG